MKLENKDDSSNEDQEISIKESTSKLELCVSSEKKNALTSKSDKKNNKNRTSRRLEDQEDNSK